MKRLDEIKARVDAATPGKWVPFLIKRILEIAADGEPDERVDSDAEFIAHARNDIPDLVLALELAIAALEDFSVAPIDFMGTDSPLRPGLINARDILTQITHILGE